MKITAPSYEFLTGGRPSTIASPSTLRAADRQFGAWLERFRPVIYAKAAQHRAKPFRRAGGLGQTTPAESPTSWADVLRDLAGGLIQYKTTDKILDAQLARAEAGLPPLETSQYAPTVKLGVDPTTASAAAAGAVGSALEQFKIPLLIGGAALAFFLFAK